MCKVYEKFMSLKSPSIKEYLIQSSSDIACGKFCQQAFGSKGNYDQSRLSREVIDFIGYSLLFLTVYIFKELKKSECFSFYIYFIHDEPKQILHLKKRSLIDIIFLHDYIYKKKKKKKNMMMRPYNFRIKLM